MRGKSLAQQCEELAAACEKLAKQAERRNVAMGSAVYNAAANLYDAAAMYDHAKQRKR